MRTIKVEYIGLCSCGQRSVLFTDDADADDPESCDALETRIDQRGGIDAVCRHCGRVCIYVECWINNVLQERLPPDEMERRGGAEAGPLPPKPWQRG